MASDINDPESIKKRHMPNPNPWVKNSPKEQRDILEKIKRQQNEKAGIQSNY